MIDPRPIALGERARGVLLLHGLTGTPYDVRPFALALHRVGLSVRAPLLAGHGSLDDLEASTHTDWLASAEAELDMLREHSVGADKRVVVLGFSMGALLALKLAAVRPGDIAGVIALSPTLRLATWRQIAVCALADLRRNVLLHDVIGHYPKRSVDARVAREALDSPSLRAFPWSSLRELVRLQDDVARRLPDVTAPLLLLHGALDHAARVDDSRIIAQRVSSAEVRRVVLARSFHLVGVDLDREQAVREVVEFTMRILLR